MQNTWFPYFSLADDISPLKVVSAKGSKLILENGKELVDGISSWWSVCHGYQNPFIISKMEEQLNTLSHIMFGGITHSPAEELSAKLISFLDTKELSRVFFSDSGSTAVEVAMKMAIQFWYEKEMPDKNHILYFEDGYHGETFAALSVSDSMQTSFPKIKETILTKIPNNDVEFQEFETLIAKENHKLAGAIIEPILQGAGGMKIHKPEIITRIWEILQKYKVLIIADECATGFYRLGTKFAFKQVGLEPDILILGKALTAGYIPFAATIAKEFIFQGICKESRFLHGPTFMANPLCCSAAIASLELFEAKDYSLKVNEISQFFSKNLPKGRIIGAVCAFDIPKKQNLEIKKAVAMGETESFIRPFGEIVYLMPPLTISENELEVLAKDILRFT
jgi:adenosylmethionine-8-amino-7-oxononanoate aminotransferase